MALVKLSELPAALAAALANEYEINEGGTSKKVTGQQILDMIMTKANIESELTGDITSHTHSAVSSHNHTLAEITDAGSIASKDFWSGTQAAYDGLGTYDANTIYFITP